MKTAIVLGSGSTYLEFREKVEAFADTCDFRIGLNLCEYANTTHHMFTNTKRFKDYHNTRNEKAELYIGSTIKQDVIDATGIKKYKRIDNDIRSQRTVGVLAISFAKEVLEAEKVYVVGMDGYCLRFGQTQHCYNNTKDDDQEGQPMYSYGKDLTVYKQLAEVAKRVNFSIITPTIFMPFYEEGIL